MEKDCFLIDEIKVSKLWNTYNLDVKINKDINLFIGANGSGKTTLLNLVNYCLSIDIEALNSISFKNIKIVFKNSYSKKTKTINLEKINDYNYVYQIGKSKYPVDYNLFSRRSSIRSARFMLYEFQKNIIKRMDIIPIKTISVYRKLDKESLIRYDSDGYKYSRYHDEDNEINPIDTRIKKLLTDFTEYREVLNEKTNAISQKFKLDVIRELLSIKKFDLNKIKYNEKDLYDTLNNLGLNTKSDKELAKAFFKSYQDFCMNPQNTTIKKMLEMRTYKVFDKAIELSKESDKEKNKVNEPVNKFLDVINKFLGDGTFNKRVSILAGRLWVENSQKDNVEITQLSSGEKQLLILLLETLLQKNTPQIYIIDEPELSLHISWQRDLISGIMQLNPNIQLIVATHSPEIVSNYSNKIINMEQIVK